MVIRVIEIAVAADTFDQGAILYNHLAAALKSHDQIVVSFAGIDIATSSFVNSSLVPLLKLMPFADLKRRIRIVESSHQINDMIKRRLTREASIEA